MISPKKNNIPPDKLNLYEKLIATNANITRKGAAEAEADEKEIMSNRRVRITAKTAFWRLF